MMDAPELRIGWLKMFLRVLRGTGGSATYAELSEFCERAIENAQREIDEARRSPKEASHVRERA